MTRPFSGILRLKLFAIAAAFTFTILIFSDLGSDRKVQASAFGPSPSFTAAPLENSCVACHSGSAPNSGPGSVVISGIPSTYRPGQEIPVTVTVTDENAVIYGFQMTALDKNGGSAGTFSYPAATPQPLQILSNYVNGIERHYIEHTINGVTPTQFSSKSWDFVWIAPSERVGKIGFYAAGNAANSDGSTGGDSIYVTSEASLAGSAPANFDTDTRSDISVFRPSTGTWFALTSENGSYEVNSFGAPGDKAAPGDYDGDGITDLSVFRPSNGSWYIRTSTGSYTVTPFGVNGDIPVAADYDGDGKTDIAVWRPSNNNWYILGSTGTFTVTNFGSSLDKPAQGDYDGDGKADIAVFRESTGTWYMLTSKEPNYLIIPFGQDGDLPVQNDYDGDGKTDIAVFRPSNATWYMITAETSYFTLSFGATGDRPAPADYDGDGKTDIAVFRNGTWFIQGTEGPSYTVIPFGQAGDVPVASAYLPE